MVHSFIFGLFTMIISNRSNRNIFCTLQ